MRNHILIFTNAVSRKNGGSSSIVDFANNCIELGFDVTAITYFGCFDKKIYKPSNVNSKLKICTLKSDIFRQLVTDKSKVFINRLSNLVHSKTFDFENKIVIDAVGLPKVLIDLLQTSGSKVVYNHAGSPNAVIKYFGMDGAQRQNIDIAKSSYLDMINQYNHILFQSPSQAYELFQMAGWDVDRTIVLRPGVSVNDINDVKSKSSILDDSRFNIVIVGSVQMRKGQHLIPEISHKLNSNADNIVFHIVGGIVDEKYKVDIESNIKALDQEDKVIFHGFKTNYLEYMNSADIILQVSEEEGVSRILREAMALKKMIISFKLDGTNDLLESGHDSLLAEYDDLDGIVESIKYVYDDRKALDAFASNALSNFELKYSQKQYHTQLKIILSELGK